MKIRTQLLSLLLLGSAQAYDLAWTYATGGNVFAVPCVHDGRVYIGSGDAKMHAVDAETGAAIWTYTTGAPIKSSAVADDGKLYFGSGDNKLYCLDLATGAKLWSYSAGQVKSSPAVWNGGVFVGCNNHTFVSVNGDTGALNWSIPTGNINKSSPVVQDGIVIFGSNDKKIRAAWCETADGHTGGSVLWTFTTGAPVISSPFATSTHVYCGSGDGKVYKLSLTTGALAWAYNTGAPVISSPTVADGVVYVGGDDMKLHAISDVTGEELWSFTTGGQIGCTPAVHDGAVYFGSRDDSIYAVDVATHAELWRYTTGGDVLSSPVITGGALYCGSLDFKLHKLTLDAAPPPAGGVLWVDDKFGWLRLPDEPVFKEDAPVAGGTRDLKLRVYVPTGADAPTLRPALIGCPGGSFSGQYFNEEACIHWAKRGYTVFSLAPRSRSLDNPPSAPELTDAFKSELEAGITRIGFPGPAMINAASAQFVDVMAALAWVRDNAATYNVDPSRIAMAGTSSGNVTMTNALYCADECGFTVLPANAGACHAGAMAPDATAYIQPGDAPMFFMHGSADMAVPPLESANLRDALTSQGIATEYHLLPGVGHNAIAALDDPTYASDGKLLITRQAEFFFEHLHLATIATAPPPGYAGWITRSGVPAMAQIMAADPDDDGVENFVEYALAGNPALPDATSTLPNQSIAGGRMALSFHRVPSRSEITLIVQAADDLTGPWGDLAKSTNGAPFTRLVPGVGIAETGEGDIRVVTIRDHMEISDPTERRFLRLIVE